VHAKFTRIAYRKKLEKLKELGIDKAIADKSNINAWLTQTKFYYSHAVPDTELHPLLERNGTTLLNLQENDQNVQLVETANEAKEDEKSYLKEIKEKNKTIAALDKKLSEAVRNYRQLKEELAALRQPENPRDFKDLDECREKYTELSRHLKLSLDFGKETETSLTLCLEKSKEQQELILLSENAFNECQKQGKLKDIKIETLRASFNDLDRFYKRKRLKRSLFQYTAGAIIGGVATYFILKRNR